MKQCASPILGLTLIVRYCPQVVCVCRAPIKVGYDRQLGRVQSSDFCSAPEYPTGGIIVQRSD